MSEEAPNIVCKVFTPRTPHLDPLPRLLKAGLFTSWLKRNSAGVYS